MNCIDRCVRVKQGAERQRGTERGKRDGGGGGEWHAPHHACCRRAAASLPARPIGEERRAGG